MRLGIDLGTTRTVVSAVLDGRHPLASFETEEGFAEWIPGIAVEVGGALHFGWDAASRLDTADGVVRSIKRAVAELGPHDVVPGLPSAPTAIELYAGFVREVVRRIRTSNLDVAEGERLEAMLAVPANATSRLRWLTIEACRRADVEVLGLLNEPTAAGIEYAYRHLGPENRRSPKRYVVVYDLGGGTFDTSAISLKGRRFELLATEGIATLGGDDFDAVIAELALAARGTSLAAFPGPVAARILDRARAAKEAMTPRSRSVHVDLESAGADAPAVTLPVSAVLEACEPLVVRTLDLLDQLLVALPAHGIDPAEARELAGVYVVGGASAFVGTLRGLRARHGKKVQLAASPHGATAIGLSVAADPGARIFVHEAVTRHFGVWREAADGHEKVFDPIFGKSDRADGDLVVQRRYRPRHSVGHLRFLECSALTPEGAPSGDLLPWREVLFPYDPSLAGAADLAAAIEPRHHLESEEIEETYRYDTRGSVSVSIANVTRGYSRTFDLGELT